MSELIYIKYLEWYLVHRLYSVDVSHNYNHDSENNLIFSVAIWDFCFYPFLEREKIRREVELLVQGYVIDVCRINFMSAMSFGLSPIALKKRRY